MNMKKAFGLMIALLTLQVAFAQGIEVPKPTTITSKYDATVAFAPDFYPYPGNEYRTSGGEPGPKYWQNKADYSINASLDTAKHFISATEEITYTNNSPGRLTFLWLQMDQNINKNASKGKFVNSGGRFRSTKDADGYTINTVQVTANGKQYNAKFNIHDTRMQVWLNAPLASGEKIKLSIPFNFAVPQYGTDRMGRVQTKEGWIYEIAQWFPRMCVYDDIQGWNVMPYLGQGEFYLEYGDINFNITVPGNLFVVGSGELLNPQECLTPAQLKKYKEATASNKPVIIRSEDDIKKPATTAAPKTWKYRITNTRDVAWAASKAFIIDGAKINLPSGKPCLALSAYPATSEGWKRSTEMTKASIEFYSKTYLEYPYPCATNVAGLVAGMEYPGIVFCSSSSRGMGLWGVTDHEFGHTWFPMIVGSNERKFAWMDEGFNTFINNFSTASFNSGEFGREIKGVYRVSGVNIYQVPEAFGDYSLGEGAYDKPAKMLHCLRKNVLGDERFDAAFREYIARWAYKHPTPWDFFRTIENVAGEDLAWFWRGWALNNWTVDIGIKNVSIVERKNVSTVENNISATIELECNEQMPMPVVVYLKEENGKEHYINIPVEVWMKGNKFQFSQPVSSKVVEAKLDPENIYPDNNSKNDSWKPAP